MSEQHKVTVYDRVAVTASVSVKQLESFLRRHGWKPRGVRGYMWQPATHWLRTDDPNEIRIETREAMGADHFSIEVEAIASRLRRQPSAVLADIAKEQA
jgi:hypothetical protein